MSHYESEYENQAQHIEGFENGLDVNDNQYLLTPEESECKTEEQPQQLDESVYDDEVEHYNDSILDEAQAELSNLVDNAKNMVENVAEQGVSNAKSLLPTCTWAPWDWLTNPANRNTILIALGVVLAVLVLMVYFKYIKMPAMPKGLGFGKTDSSSFAGSSFGNNSSLGMNYMKLNPDL